MTRPIPRFRRPISTIIHVRDDTPAAWIAPGDLAGLKPAVLWALRDGGWLVAVESKRGEGFTAATVFSGPVDDVEVWLLEDGHSRELEALRDMLEDDDG